MNRRPSARQAGMAPGSLKMRRTKEMITLRATGQVADRLLAAVRGALVAEAGRYTTVRFVDNGQDTLEWDLDGCRTVVDARPYGREVWAGTRVVSKLEPGRKLAIVSQLTGETVTFMHEVAEVLEGVNK